MDRLTEKDKVALERLLTITSCPRMLPSLWQSYSKCTELWFLSTLSLERPCYMLLLTEHIFRVSACGRRGGYDLNKCCWKKKSETLPRIVSCFSFHSSLHCLYMLIHIHRLISSGHHLGHHHKEKWAVLCIGIIFVHSELSLPAI